MFSVLSITSSIAVSTLTTASVNSYFSTASLSILKTKDLASFKSSDSNETPSGKESVYFTPAL